MTTFSLLRYDKVFVINVLTYKKTRKMILGSVELFCDTCPQRQIFYQSDSVAYHCRVLDEFACYNYSFYIFLRIFGKCQEIIQ